MRGVGRVGVVLVVALIVAGCGGDDDRSVDEAAADGGPVLASVRGAPGTELRDGFVVAEGSTLVGHPFPGPAAAIGGGPAGAERDWWALLVVSGDPTRVLEAYLSQAEAAGMEPVPVPEGAPEFLREDLPAEAQQHMACGVVAEGGPPGYACSRLAVTDGAAPCLRATVVRRPIGDTMDSSLRLRYTTDPSGCSAAGSSLIGDPSAPVPALPDTWPAPPVVGEPLGDAFGLLAPLAVAEGSTVAAPPFDDGCFGSAAMLAVTGEPLEVLDAYGIQLDELAPTAERAPITSEDLDDGAALHTLHRSVPAGGNTYAARLLDVGDGPALLVLTACSG